MNILLDTNALVWLLDKQQPGHLGVQVKSLIRHAHSVYVSPISLVELRIKAMIGKLDIPEDIQNDIVKSGVKICDFKMDAANTVNEFPQLIRHDPFDRMLLAQAQSENMKFVTADKLLLGLNLSFVVNAFD